MILPYPKPDQGNKKNSKILFVVVCIFLLGCLVAGIAANSAKKTRKVTKADSSSNKK